MAGEVVGDDDIAGLQRRDQYLLDISEEKLSVDGSIEQPRRVNAIMPQGGDEGQCVPVSVGDFDGQSGAARAPTTQWRHVGFDPGLVDEDQARGINQPLVMPPLSAPPSNVGTILFAGDGVFYIGIPKSP